MSDKILKSNPKKTNFFDGQRVSEADLDDNQKYFEDIISSSNLDFHSSGVLKKNVAQRVLLDTRSPSSSNPSKGDLNTRTFDGIPIKMNLQPKNKEYGSRLEVELLNSGARGREYEARVLLIGLVFDPQFADGILTYEVLSYDQNKVLLTSNHFLEVKCIILNNISYGSGTTDSGIFVNSKNLGGDIIIRECDSAMVFAKSVSISNSFSPNFDLSIMYGKNGLSNDISSGIYPTNSIDELFINYSMGSHTFDANGDIGVSFGQKFVSSSNNLQKVELLMSVDEDATNGVNWDGDLVFSLYELEASSDLRSSNPLDGSPKLIPIAEVSLDQQDMLYAGYKLESYPLKIEIDFSSSKVSDPKSGAILKGFGYAIIVSRSGSNNYGNINIHSGENDILAKKNLGMKVSIKESYELQRHEFVEFDPNYAAYISNEEKSLWFKVHSLQFEVTSGVIYDKGGRVLSIPDLQQYVGETTIPFKMDPIDLASKNSKNFICVSSSDKFGKPDVHPRTGNFVYTRIENFPKITVFEELDPIFDKEKFVILGSIKDSSPKSSEVLNISIDMPCFADRDFIYILNPSNQILSDNLIGRKISLDKAYLSEYIINKVERYNLKYGDIDNSGSYSSSDLQTILDLAGNSITSVETQRAILGGSIDIVDFIKSDLNGDGIIDGTDIELMETAIDGSVTFPVGKNFTLLKVYFESETLMSENPEIQSFGPISTAQADTTITISGFHSKKALLLRPEDIVEITSGLNSGKYYVKTKQVQSDGTTVVLELKDESGDLIIFFAESQNYIKIYSKNITNAFLDNLSLLNTPFQSLESRIIFNNYFQERNISVCDLRSFVEFSFQSDEDKSCLCITDDDICDAKAVNHKYIPGDLYLEGRIKSKNGDEFSSDYEFANVTVDMPVGTLSGCKIDLYNTFVKSEGSTCFTKSGYNAMKFSDGTYVGCEDSGSDTDISKGRVKIVGGFASLHVDAFVDGYEVDGDSSITEYYEPSEISNEVSTNFFYTIFNSTVTAAYWSRSGFSGQFSILDNSNGPLEIGLETHSTSSETLAYIENPTEMSSSKIIGDFIYDFEISRDVVEWDDYDLLNGKVEFYSQIDIDNLTSGSSYVRIGYRVSSKTTVAFFSGKIFDNSGSELYSFDFEEDLQDVPGDRVRFRVRRVNDAVYGYYTNPSKFDPDTNPSQEFSLIGRNLDMQPGSGDSVSKFYMKNYPGVSTGKLFKVNLFEVDVHSNLEVTSELASYTVSRNYSNDECSRQILTLPLPYRSNIKILSANLILNSETTGVINGELLFTPFVNLNMDNIGSFYNVAKEPSSVSRKIELLTNVVSGNDVSIDIMDLVLYFQSRTGHIPGQKKGILMEFFPGSSYSSGTKSFTFGNQIRMEYIYEDYTTGVVFQIGVDVDPKTGIATFKTKNILYDLADKSKRTRVNFGVHLKKSGFANKDIEVSVSDLQRLRYGIGSCIDNTITDAAPDGDCFFVLSDAATGTFVEGPFPCNFYSNSSGIAISVNNIIYISVSVDGSEFVFDGIKGTSLNLYEGKTYIFDVSDSSLGGANPISLAFRDLVTSAQITSGFVQNGTPGTAGAEVVFTVPDNSDTLEYFDLAGVKSGTGNVYTPKQ